jgi:hypothetical protein
LREARRRFLPFSIGRRERSELIVTNEVFERQ